MTKQSNIKNEDQSTLEELLSLSPTLATLCSFVNEMHELFGLRRSKTQAWKIWSRIRRNRTYLSTEHLRKALDVLSRDNMKKLLTYLDNAASVRSKVRKNNRVERCNRVLRYLEKVRYKWSSRRTIDCYILLQFANWMKRNEIEASMAV